MESSLLQFSLHRLSSRCALAKHFLKTLIVSALMLKKGDFFMIKQFTLEVRFKYKTWILNVSYFCDTLLNCFKCCENWRYHMFSYNGFELSFNRSTHSLFINIFIEHVHIFFDQLTPVTSTWVFLLCFIGSSNELFFCLIDNVVQVVFLWLARTKSKGINFVPRCSNSIGTLEWAPTLFLIR